MDRVAIVTGATGGIGRATAIRRCTRADSSEKTPSVSAEADNALGSDRDRLMAAAQAGDVDAYRTLLSELAVWLRRYYGRRLPPPMIEDAVQDALLAIHEKRHTYDPGCSLAPWLAAIARYKWTDRLRSLKSGAAKPLGENLGIPDRGDSVIAGTTCQPLAELRAPQAEMVRSGKLESHSAEEACRATGRLSALIKVNFHRGIRRLADIIRATGDAF